MSKNSIEDIVKKKSLKDVLPSRNTSRPKISSFNGNTEPPAPIPGTKRSKAPMWILWSIILVLVFFSLIIVSSFFSRVTIEVTPKQAMVVLDGEILNANINAPTGQLEFGLITREIVEEERVTATEVRNIEEKASGQITIFNNFGPEPQELVANTRFETPDGKIYRINRAVTVPGKVGEEPGSIDITVYADEPGADYNIGLTDFTIPGFAGSPRFAGFSARSITEMSGGFSGNVQTVSESEENRVRESLRQRLQGQANTAARLESPDGFILLADTVLTHFESLNLETETGASQAAIREKMILTGILINERQLASFVAQTFINDYRGEEIEIVNLPNLRFSLEGDAEDLDPRTISSISIEVNGQAHLVWVIDEDSLIDNVRGLSKGDFQSIITRFPSIESLTPRFRPPWMRTAPDNPDKIKVRIEVNE